MTFAAAYQNEMKTKTKKNTLSTHTKKNENPTANTRSAGIAIDRQQALAFILSFHIFVYTVSALKIYCRLCCRTRCRIGNGYTAFRCYRSTSDAPNSSRQSNKYRRPPPDGTHQHLAICAQNQASERNNNKNKKNNSDLILVHGFCEENEMKLWC